MPGEAQSARFEAIVLPHLDGAYNLARWLVRNGTDAEDLVQEACLRAWKGFGGFRGTDGRSWLLAIVRNTCYSWLRGNRRNELAVEFNEDLHSEGPAVPEPEPLWRKAPAAKARKSARGIARGVSRSHRPARAGRAFLQGNQRRCRRPGGHGNVSAGARSRPLTTLSCATDAQGGVKMRCEEARPLIDGYLDGELDFEHNLELESHLEGCAVCAPARRSALELRSAIQQHVPYFRAPRALENRVRAMLREQAAAEPRINFFSRSWSWPRPMSWSWLAAAAMILLVLFGSTQLVTNWPVTNWPAANWLGASHDDLIAQEVVSGHIRSLMASHLSDVISTDQHTVKPWFDGKLDFAPPVVDLASAGFPLVVAGSIMPTAVPSPPSYTSGASTTLMCSYGRRPAETRPQPRKRARATTSCTGRAAA